MIQDLRPFCNGFEAQNTVFIASVESSFSRMVIPLGLESKLSPACEESCHAQAVDCSFFPLLYCLADLHRTHDEIVLLHCFLWPLVTFVVGVLIVVLTICAKSLAVKAEAMKKRKFS